MHGPDLRKLLEAVTTRLSIDLDDRQLDLLLRHFELLLRWNRKMNLTSIRDPRAIANRHFGESLFLAKTLGITSGTVADIGSGAGFPGFPLAVALPNVQVTLIESVTKKAAFLKEVARGVPNVSVFPGRFEALERTFDWAVMRGVALKPLLVPLRRKTKRLALLTGRSDAATLSLPCERQVVPNSRNSVILMFHVEQWDE